MIKNNKGEIIGTWTLFDEMNDVTLAYNLGSLNKEELELVPYSYIAKWEEWKQKQIKNKYWNNSLHCWIQNIHKALTIIVNAFLIGE